MFTIDSSGLQANSYAQSLEKKQKGFDKVIDEWKKKCSDLAAELDNSQRDARNFSTEVFKVRWVDIALKMKLGKCRKKLSKKDWIECSWLRNKIKLKHLEDSVRSLPSITFPCFRNIDILLF